MRRKFKESDFIHLILSHFRAKIKKLAGTEGCPPEVAEGLGCGTPPGRLELFLLLVQEEPLSLLLGGAGHNRAPLRPVQVGLVVPDGPELDRCDAKRLGRGLLLGETLRLGLGLADLGPHDRAVARPLLLGPTAGLIKPIVHKTPFAWREIKVSPPVFVRDEQ